MGTPTRLGAHFLWPLTRAGCGQARACGGLRFELITVTWWSSYVKSSSSPA